MEKSVSRKQEIHYEALDSPISDKLVRGNVKILKQLLECVDLIEKDLYSSPNKNSAPLGAHIRHIIEFYQALIKTLNDPVSTHLCYDERCRNTTYENCKDAAAQEIRKIIVRLDLLKGDENLNELSAIIDPDSPMEVIKTTVNRELFHVLDHAIHHMALIKMIANENNIKLDENFGLANATKAHLKQTKA